MDEGKIDRLIEDTLIDCYNQEECQSSFNSALEDTASGEVDFKLKTLTI